MFHLFWLSLYVACQSDSRHCHSHCTPTKRATNVQSFRRHSQHARPGWRHCPGYPARPDVQPQLRRLTNPGASSDRDSPIRHRRRHQPEICREQGYRGKRRARVHRIPEAPSCARRSRGEWPTLNWCKIVESQEQSEREIWGVIVLSRDGSEVLLQTAEPGFAFPVVEIPCCERLAENLTAALRRDWGCDAVCLFTAH